jgi:hypothetical protein
MQPALHHSLELPKDRQTGQRAVPIQAEKQESCATGTGTVESVSRPAPAGGQRARQRD